MRPLADMPDTVAAKIAVVFADIDDTITHEGRLPGRAYQALEDLKQAGLAVAPITGRPAGWCDMIARFWPVDGVVGENGAFYFAYDHANRTMRRSFTASDAERRANRERLDAVRERILAEVPGAAVAGDQLYREADLAIDFCEERIVFVGDSPNDAPMFGFFPNACGVANVLDFAGRMDADPAYRTTARGGYGFIEVAERILSARSRQSGLARGWQQGA